MRFGVREICDVVFKAKSQTTIGDLTFQAGQPVLYIDTATTSNMEVATTTSYANGGRGNSRLIAWEGEKTLTFTVTDALLSPLGLSVLSGAGLLQEARDNNYHMHMTTDLVIEDSQVTLQMNKFDANVAPWFDADKTVIKFCDDSAEGVKTFGTVLDNAGAGIAFLGAASEISGNELDATLSTHKTAKVYSIGYVKDENGNITGENKVTITFENAEQYEGKTIRLDYYVLVGAGMQTVEIDAANFAGSYYVEASTLFRREDTGKDMPAELIFPNVKIQSGFTFTMASTGDPSTFDFVMDAFPGYTMFDRTKKVLCAIQILGVDGIGENAADDGMFHSTSANHVETNESNGDETP